MGRLRQVAQPHLQDGINNKKVYDFLAEALSQPEAVTTIPADIAQETVKICHMMRLGFTSLPKFRCGLLSLFGKTMFVYGKQANWTFSGLL